MSIKISLALTFNLLRKGLISCLKNDKILEVIFDTDDGEELILSVTKFAPDVILLDLGIKEKCSRKTIKHLTRKFPDIKLIMFASDYKEREIHEFVKLGVHSFLLKDCEPEYVIETIKRVHKKGISYDNHIIHKLINILPTELKDKIDNNQVKLSEHEIQILKLICDEKSNQEISNSLFLSKRTIEWHKQQILLKTNSRNIVGLVKFALRTGIINDLDYS